ncbi:MAG: universal stress protein [Proteobacteria bacterium]|nr:universal stress protein [Pseudomonadota bacterium]
MKSILLAVEGPSPNPETLRYSLELARRIRARLLVVQVLHQPAKKGLQRFVEGVRRGSRVLSDAMVAVTYSEAGDHDTAQRIMAMLSRADEESRQLDPDEDEVTYSVEVLHGDPEKEIVRMVEKNRDVVLAVCEQAPDKGRRTSCQNLIESIRIPLVFVEAQKL